MAFVNLPDFTARQLLTAAQLDQIVAALQGFSAQPTDIAWPLVAQGNIDFDRTYGIIGLRTFWNIINADEYDTLQAAIDAAEAAGGGCIVIPPDTTIVADGVSIEASNILIKGYGPSSVLQLTSGSTSGFLLRTGTASLSKIGLMNLMLDGQSTGTGQQGIIVRRVTNFFMRGVFVQNFTGDAVELTNDGSDGNACVDASIKGCEFSGGSASHIVGDDIDGLLISNVRSKSAGADAIALEPTNTTTLMKDIQLDSIRVHNPTGDGILVVGSTGTPGSANHARVQASNCKVYGATANGFQFGEASKMLQEVDIDGCTAHAAGADGFAINANGGELSDCRAYSTTGDGLDLIDSEDVRVVGCNFPSAGAYGIDADGTSDCSLQGNDVQSAGTAAILKTNTTNLRCGHNYGDHGPSVGIGYIDHTNYAIAATGDIGVTYTIPGGTFKVGDLLRVTAHISLSGGTSIAGELRAGGTAMGTIGTNLTSQELFAQWNIKIVATSGASSTSVMVTVVPSTNNATAAVTIDWTTNKALTFQVTTNTGGVTVTMRRFIVELIGAK